MGDIKCEHIKITSHERELAAHPHCNDPAHPGCELCWSGDELDAYLELIRVDRDDADPE